MSTPSLLERVEKPVIAEPPLPADTAAFLAIIDKAITSKDVDVNKLERLMSMYESMIARRAQAEFNEALTRTQEKIKQIRFDARNEQTRSNYARYTKIDREIRPLYNAEGFNMTFDTEPSEFPDQILFVCDVSHSGGHTRRYRLPLPTDGKGAKGGDVMTKTHATVAATSYGMRCLAKMIWNIAIIVDEDDTDGNMPEEFVSEAQAADLQKLLVEAKFDRTRLLKYVSNKAKAEVRSISEIPARFYEEAKTAINKARNEQPAQKGGR